MVGSGLQLDAAVAFEHGTVDRQIENAALYAARSRRFQTIFSGCGEARFLPAIFVDLAHDNAHMQWPDATMLSHAFMPIPGLYSVFGMLRVGVRQALRMCRHRRTNYLTLQLLTDLGADV